MSWGLGPYVSRTDNDGFTFRPIVDISNYKNSSLFYSNRYHFKLIENNGTKVTFGGTNEYDDNGYLLVSTDTCKTYTKIKKTTLNLASYPGYSNATSIPNLNIGNNWYSMASRSIIYNYNENFDRNSFIKDTNLIFDYIHTKDTNSYLVHCANKADSTSEIRYTSDRGKNWVLIKKFPYPETESHYDEITVNNKKYFAIVHVNLDEMMYHPEVPIVSSVDIVNLENNECLRIFYWKSPDGNPEYGTMGVGITSDSNVAYIAFQDSLFVIPDFNDKSKWKYYLMPTPGSRMIRPIKKFGDRFYGRYADEYNPWAGYSAWFKPLDTLMNFPVSVDDTEINTYLTYSTPYPIPASNIVHAEIFWDMRYDIGNSDIAVYDYKGLKVADRKSLTLDRKNSYSGVLSWDCAGYESGVYFVLLRHGGTTRTIPIVVGK